jgi:hypothetical protein
MPYRVFRDHRVSAGGRPPRAPAEVRILDVSAGAMTGVEGGVMDRLLIRLKELPLPARVRGCLERLGLERLGDLVGLPPEALLEQKNFGRSSLRILTRMLARLGLGLGMIVEGWPPADVIALSRERSHSTSEAVRRIFIPRNGGKLEDELRQLAAPAGSHRNVSIVVRHLGWDGRGGATLETVGREHRISRQRALQIVKRVRRQYQGVHVLPPRLDSCLLAATPRLAERADAVEDRLYRAGETNSPFRVEGLLAAAETLGLPAPIEMFFLGADRVVARKGTRGDLLSIIGKARRVVGRRGAVCPHSLEGKHTTEDLRELLSLDPRFEWLEESESWFWFRPAFAAVPRRTENRLVNEIMKALWVAGALHISQLWTDVSRRARKSRVVPPKSALLGICRRIPWCTVRGETVALYKRAARSAAVGDGCDRVGRQRVSTSLRTSRSAPARNSQK